MKILILTNKFPPYTIGGYELACADIAEGLQRNGHEVYILTSTYGVGKPVIEQNIFRYLHLFEHANIQEIMFTLWWHQYQDQRYVQKVLAQVKPDLLYIWNLERLSYSLIPVYETYQLPTVYAISSYWMLHDTVYNDWHELWFRRAGSPFRDLLKRMLRQWTPSVKKITSEHIMCQYAHFFSKMLLDEHHKHGVDPNYSQVIYHGIHVADFVPPEQNPISKQAAENTLQLLYSGQIGKHKGVHTALEALQILVHQKGIRNVRLNLVGPTPFPEYRAELEHYIATHHLEPYVIWTGKVSRRELVRIYHTHDMLIFPSIWPEPFSITVLEAMAAKLPVIGTPTGGSAEILIHKKNSLTFPPEQNQQLADRIEQLIHDTALRQRIITKAFSTVQQQFDIQQIIKQIEQFLHDVIGRFGG